MKRIGIFFLIVALLSFMVGTANAETPIDTTYTIVKGKNPMGITFDRKGNLYIAEASADKVTKISSDGVKTTVVSNLSGPTGVAFDSNDNLYIAEYDENRIVKLEADGSLVPFIENIDEPYGIAFDSHDVLYVSLNRTGAVFKVEPDHSLTSFVKLNEDAPLGITFDSNDNLYLCAYFGKQVLKVDKNNSITSITTTSFYPGGVAFNSTGAMYISNYDSSVDLEAPVNAIGYPKTGIITHNSAEVLMNINKAGTAYYKVVPSGTTPPTIEDIKASGTSVSLAANTEAAVTLENLTPETTYDVYVVAEDDDQIKIIQSDPTKVTFTTTAAPAATLSNLTVDGHTLNPTFSTTQDTYTVNVGNDVSDITVTATPSDEAASVTINGKVTTSDTISLSVGENFIPVIVTAKDGIATKTYTITVTRAGSSDTTLKSLAVSAGTLSPTFEPNTDAYTVNVGNDVSSMNVTAIQNDPNATVSINGNTTTSDTIALTAGQTTTIPIVVTAQDGGKKTYTVTVTVQPANIIVTGVTLNKSALTLTAGGAVGSLTATVNPGDATNKDVTWSSSNPNVATVDANGVVTPKTAGTATITVTTADGNKTANCLVTVKAISSSSGGGSRDYGPSPSSHTRTSSVLVGENEKGKQAASVEITRTVTADGKKSDTVTLDARKAAEAISKATGTMNMVMIPIPDLKGSEAQEIVANVQKEALAIMADKGFSAQVVTDKATIELPKETMASLNKQDIYMKIEPVTKENEIQQTKTLLSVQAKDGNVIGTPLHIETNFSDRTKITLPLTGMNIPTDVKKQEDFLQSLAVFIEHSDGEKKVDKGEIQYDEKHNPIGLSVWVDKFSTFTLVNLPKTKDDPKPQVPVFTDIQGHWAQSHIQQLVKSGAVSGYPDGTFKPNKTITRAEFVAMVVKAFGLQPKENKDIAFTDTKNHWAKAAIETAYANGIINGYNATTFGADDTITREQMAVILMNIKRNGEGKQLSFKDTTSISAWAQKAVSRAVEEGIITGYPDQTFKPNKTATRAEAVTMIHNALTIK